MARWLVKLEGEAADLEEFPLRFPHGDIYAVEKSGGVYVAGPELERLNDAGQVREHAKGAIEEMSAIISLLWAPFRKPSVGSVVREDDRGGLSVWVTPLGVEARAKAGLATVATRADGARDTVHDEQLPTEAQRLLAASRSTGAFANRRRALGVAGPCVVAALPNCRGN
jgi:hypothetical protein